MNDVQRSSVGQPWDEIFSGGVMDGSVTLLTGPPGVGKTVMLLQIVAGLAENRHRNVLYVLRDQPPSEARRTMERLGVPQGRISIATGFDDGLIARIGTFAAVVVDAAEQGEDLQKVANACRAVGVPLFIVRHTPKAAEEEEAFTRVDYHSADMAVELDYDGEQRELRILKYRFGKIGDCALVMTANGLQIPPKTPWYKQLFTWLKWAFQGRKR
jgi:DNA repair protein RadA/Sms